MLYEAGRRFDLLEYSISTESCGLRFHGTRLNPEVVQPYSGPPLGLRLGKMLAASGISRFEYSILQVVLGAYWEDTRQAISFQVCDQKPRNFRNVLIRSRSRTTWRASRARFRYFEIRSSRGIVTRQRRRQKRRRMRRNPSQQRIRRCSMLPISDLESLVDMIGRSIQSALHSWLYKLWYRNGLYILLRVYPVKFH